MLKRVKTWIKRRQTLKKQRENNLQRKRIYQEFNKAYNFLKWIEQQLPNRKARKQFLNDLIRSGTVSVPTVKSVLDHIDKFLEIVDNKGNVKKKYENQIKKNKTSTK